MLKTIRFVTLAGVLVVTIFVLLAGRILAAPRLFATDDSESPVFSTQASVQSNLGDRSTAVATSTSNVLDGMSVAVQVTARGYHTCALAEGGGIKCWGWNYYGQLGDGTTTDRITPVDVNSLTSDVVATTAGDRHTCALTENGGVKCWGWNEYGQLGDGTTVSRLTPVDVSGLTSGVVAVSAGDAHTCALTENGGVKCWGWNAFGQLGDGTTTNRHTPVDVSGLTSGVAAVAPGSSHTCVLTDGDGIMCWGQNWYGQLGDSTTTSRYTPVDVSGLAGGVTSVTVGNGHTCALTEVGGIKCWGSNSHGQLGNGIPINRNTPVDVSGLTNGVAAVAAGRLHTCTLTESGRAKCWGFNSRGQLGDGTTTDRTTPVDVSGLSGGAIAVVPSREHTCALTEGGGVKCWGWNHYGQLGDDTTINRYTPVAVVGFGTPLTAAVWLPLIRTDIGESLDNLPR